MAFSGLCTNLYILYIQSLHIMGGKKKKTSNKKDSQLVLRINRQERDIFVELCEELDTSAAREIRKFIKHFITQHRPTDITH
ncbi:hypothetical protein VQ7734_00499 [Vibrio quintilis]|uniref:Uncharacterized protein n=1 Tax=Vibrio quintilis TaxID=1117707 RepID=A0A1M7YQ73_9VIBR|nr:hypothetical protein VQ7734_00499 [Vibrio quintilis]